MTYLDQAVLKYLVIPASRIIIDLCPPDREEDEECKYNLRCEECWNREEVKV